MTNQTSEPGSSPSERNAMMSALFANLVLQHTNMASIFLGRVPHPETGKVETDLEHAQYFIDLLEMLEAKTKGNLDKNEQNLLRQSLTGLRMAFVEAASKSPAPAEEKPETPPQTANADAGTAPEHPTPDDSKKKFTKKY